MFSLIQSLDIQGWSFLLIGLSLLDALFLKLYEDPLGKTILSKYWIRPLPFVLSVGFHTCEGFLINELLKIPNTPHSGYEMVPTVIRVLWFGLVAQSALYYTVFYKSDLFQAQILALILAIIKAVSIGLIVQYWSSITSLALLSTCFIGFVIFGIFQAYSEPEEEDSSSNTSKDIPERIKLHTYSMVQDHITSTFRALLETKTFYTWVPISGSGASRPKGPAYSFSNLTLAGDILVAIALVGILGSVHSYFILKIPFPLKISTLSISVFIFYLCYGIYYLGSLLLGSSHIGFYRVKRSKGRFSQKNSSQSTPLCNGITHVKLSYKPDTKGSFVLHVVGYRQNPSSISKPSTLESIMSNFPGFPSFLKAPQKVASTSLTGQYTKFFTPQGHPVDDAMLASLNEALAKLQQIVSKKNS